MKKTERECFCVAEYVVSSRSVVFILNGYCKFMNDQILIRFITRRCSAEEIEQIERWIAEDSSNVDKLFETERLWNLKDESRFSAEQEVDRAYERFLVRQKTKSLQRSMTPRVLNWIRYSAAAAVIGLLSLNLYQMQQGEGPSGLNTVEVAKGEKASITLSDGTEVWLNAETKITYPSQFAAKTRRVSIEGEAYFKVAKDAGKPFIVNGNGFNINVLGTQFNVSAHSGEDVRIALKEGEISVDTADSESYLIDTPGYQLQLTTAGVNTLQETDVATIDSWTRGEFVFTAQSLATIVKSLERTFDIPIVLSDENLARELFNCRVKAGASLFDIMDLLSETKRISYRSSADSVVVIENQY